MVAVEQKKERDKTPQEIAAAAAQPETEKKPKVSAADLSQKTTGEKYYGILKFGIAEVFILAATAGIAYWARYGQDKGYNIFKQIQKLSDKVLSPIAKIGKEGSKARDIGTVIAGAAASTMVTFHGGNTFAPAMKWFDNKKNDIVDYFNKRFGKPGELEAGQERLKDDPKQSWGDIVKGRLASWGIVFTSFVSAALLMGKSKKNGDYHFNNFEEGFGRKLAGFTKAGKEVAVIPITQKLPEHLAKNKTYRFGKILALDIFATTAAIMIWSVFSELSAKKRQKAEHKTVPEISPSAITEPAQDNSVVQESRDMQFTNIIKPRAQSHAGTLVTQLEALETQPAQLGA